MPVIQCLVDALEDDPFYQVITVDFNHDPAQQRETLAAYFQHAFDEGERYGFSIVPGGSYGVAIWLTLQATDTKSAKLIFLESLLGEQGYRNYLAILDFMTPLAALWVDQRAWYLSIVGVCPQHQGQGLGAVLLRPTLARADDEQVQCYLETFTPRNVGFYQRLGFEVRHSYLEPVTGQPYLIMVREPVT